MSEDQAQGLREYVDNVGPANAPIQPVTLEYMHVTEPDWHIRVGIKENSVCRVDWSASIMSGALSTPPTVDQVKQWLADAVKFLEGK